MSRVYFWRNFLNKELEFPYKKDNYVFTYYFINQKTSDIVADLVYLPDKRSVAEFIKFYILPSSFISRLFQDEGYLLKDVVDFQEIVSFMEDNRYRIDKELIEQYVKYNESVSKILESDLNFEKNIRDFINDYNEFMSYRNLFFSNIEIYRNMEDFGKRLIMEHKETDSIDDLEDELELREEEIVDVFTKLDENPFMQLRIKDFLMNKLEVI